MDAFAERLLADNSAAFDQLCHRFGVTRMRLFGSAARDSGGKVNDLDFLVEYGPGRHELDPLDALVGLQLELESLFGVPVDVVDWNAARSARFRSQAELDAIEVYAV